MELNAHNENSEAEITIGIICSCVPALPPLYRHYVPKIKSRLSYAPRSGHRSDPTKSKSTKTSSISFRGTKSSSQNHDPENPRLLQGEYLELGDVTYHDGIGHRPSGPTTRIEGGLRNASRDSMDADAAFTGEGIQKTVRLESYPQPAPPVYQGMNGVRKV